MACVSFPDHFQLNHEKFSPVLNKVHISFQWLFLTITSTLNTYQNVSTNVRGSQVCQPAIWSVVPSSITNCQESDLRTANLWLNPSQIMWSLGLQSAAGPPASSHYALLFLTCPINVPPQIVFHCCFAAHSVEMSMNFCWSNLLAGRDKEKLSRTQM